MWYECAGAKEGTLGSRGREASLAEASPVRGGTQEKGTFG